MANVTDWKSNVAGEIVVHDAYVLTVDDGNRLYERGTIRIADGRITDVRPTRDGDARIDALRVIDGDGMLAMPDDYWSCTRESWERTAE